MNLLQSLLRRNDAMTQRYDGVDFSGIDPLDFAWSFGGNTYMGLPGTTGNRTETLESSFLGLVQGAYKRNSVVFACMRARLSVFSEARFQFRQMRNGRPGDLFGTQELALLENPWPNGTTGDLLTRTLQDADLAGNAYWTVRNGVLRRMRPDWVSIVMGSRTDKEIGPDDLDAELLGYFYWPGGPFNKQSEPVFLLPDEVAHFAPTPDPIAHYRGMSWLTPIIREVEADTAATVHKLAFFQNGATLQTIISFKDMKQEVFEAFVKKMDLAHKGAQNAYKTLYLGGGADATVVGADLKQLDFKATQGAGETRIAAAAGVPPAIVGLSEGLQGSSLNAGNLGQLRRQFAEGTLSTLWRNAAGSLSTLINVPSGAELWYDTRDIPFLREDRKDRADIAQQQAATLSSLINAGYTPESAIAAVESEDWTLLVHTGLFSVQLQPPGSGALPGSIEAGVKLPSANGSPPAVNGVPKARAAIAARAWEPAELARTFNPDELREPHSGKWTSGGVAGALKDALKLGDKIGLAHDEKLVGSSKIDGDAGGIRMALTDQGGKRMLRLGLGSEGYGQRDRDNGIPAWDGNPPKPPLTKVQRQHLDAESDVLDQEYESASPARQAEIQARLDAIRDQLGADDQGFNGTAKLDEYGMDRLATKLRPALDEALDQAKAEQAAWDEIEALQAKGNPDPARMAQLREIARADSTDYLTFTKGIIPGSAWGDVHYEVYLDESEPRVMLGVQPKDAPDDWGDVRDWQGHFDPAATKKFLRQLAQYSGNASVTRAAGHDPTPGHDELHHY